MAEEVADAEHEEKVAEISLTIEVLHQIPLFKYCTYKELVHIMNITEVRDYASGEKVFEEGSEGDYLFIVMKGKVKLEKGKTYITSFGAGTHFGEMALVDRLPRSGSATAEEDSRLLRIHRRDFYAIVRQEGGLSVRILWSFVQVLAERLRSTTLALCDALEEKPSDGPDPGPDPKVLNQD